jgi:hypothetical protein
MSRQQAFCANLSAICLKNIDNQATDGEEKSKPEVIKLGLDLHARQVTSPSNGRFNAQACAAVESMEATE